MNESYTGSSRIKKLTVTQIRKMKENMRKVPSIQKKSDDYHQLEGMYAEKVLDSYIKKEISPTTKINKTPAKQNTWREKIKNYLFK